MGKRHAVKAGMSVKAYWHVAKTEAINVDRSNTFLTKQGRTSHSACICYSIYVIVLRR